MSSSRPDPVRKPSGRSAAAPTVEAFLRQFNEPLVEVLNLDSWRVGRDPAEEYRRIEEEVRLAVERETDDQRHIREEILPLLAQSPVPGAGLHRVDPDEVLQAQRWLLFNGVVEACDGTSQVHDTLALTIHQIGVSLVSYRGERGCWRTQLFRRDLRVNNANPADAVLELIGQREERGGLHPSPDDALSELAQRGLMSYAERAVLADRCRAAWRMGHGSLAPFELIGAKFTDVAVESIRVIRKLVEHGRFVFVASQPKNRGLLTIGQGLRPLEYAIIGTLQDRVARYLEDWAPTHEATVSTAWDGEVLPAADWVRRFRDEVAPRVVYGLYRATHLAPPQLFYAHVEHAHVAARIAIADSVFLEERGFPMLIDLADRVCQAVYGGGSLREMAESAYAAAGAPFRYGSERSTRPA